MSASDRRQQLVDIGLDLLETRPIHDLALDEVAAVAGVSRTLVFHYFPSKGDYFAAVVSDAGTRLMQAVPKDPATDVQARLRSMVRAFLKFVQRKRGAYVALVRGASGGDPKVLAALDEVRATHVDRWLDAAEWSVRDEITRLAVRGWLGALEEVALAAPSSPVRREPIVELLVQGLFADLELASRLRTGDEPGDEPAGQALPAPVAARPGASHTPEASGASGTPEAPATSGTPQEPGASGAAAPADRPAAPGRG